MAKGRRSELDRAYASGLIVRRQSEPGRKDAAYEAIPVAFQAA